MIENKINGKIKATLKSLKKENGILSLLLHDNYFKVGFIILAFFAILALISFFYLPLLGFSRPQDILPSVDFPDPLSPTIAIFSDKLTVNETSSSAVTIYPFLPKNLLTSWISRM